MDNPAEEPIETVEEIDANVEDTEGTPSLDAEPEVSALVYDIDGEEVSEDTIREWKAGHMMQADYTKKTQTLADERRDFGQEQEKLKADTDQLSEKVSFVSELVEEFQKLSVGEVDATLIDSDPEEYMRQKARQDANRGQLDAISAKLAEVKNEINEQNAQKLHKALGWHDEAKKADDIKLIEGYTSAKGMGQADFAKIEHPAVMEAFLDAAKYKALQEQKKSKQVRKAPKTPSPEGQGTPEVKSLAERMYGNK